jgi:hypothetical protein
MFSTEDAVASFNMYNGKVYFKELYNDTLFYLTNSFSLLPELAFKLGKYSEPDSFRENLPPPTGNLSGYVNVRNVFQSASFLMIDCYFAHNIPAPEKNIKQKQWYEEGKPWYNTTRVLGLYNKANDSLLFSKLTSTANTLFTTGLYNDIDAGSRFYPFKQVNDSTFVMGINANLFKGHIASEDFKNNNPKYPDKKKSLEQFGSKLADFDELILMYVTIK